MHQKMMLLVRLVKREEQEIHFAREGKKIVLLLYNKGSEGIS